MICSAAASHEAGRESRRKKKTRRMAMTPSCIKTVGRPEALRGQGAVVIKREV